MEALFIDKSITVNSGQNKRQFGTNIVYNLKLKNIYFKLVKMYIYQFSGDCAGGIVLRGNYPGGNVRGNCPGGIVQKGMVLDPSFIFIIIGLNVCYVAATILQTARNYSSKCTKC